jgi:hypothetical protein
MLPFDAIDLMIEMVKAWLMTVCERDCHIRAPTAILSALCSPLYLLFISSPFYGQFGG